MVAVSLLTEEPLASAAVVGPLSNVCAAERVFELSELEVASFSQMVSLVTSEPFASNTISAVLLRVGNFFSLFDLRNKKVWLFCFCQIVYFVLCAACI